MLIKFIHEHAVEMSEQGIVLKMADFVTNVHGFLNPGFGTSTARIKPPSVERFRQALRGGNQPRPSVSWFDTYGETVLLVAGVALAALLLLWWFRPPGGKPDKKGSPDDELFLPPSPPDESKRSVTQHQHAEDNMRAMAAQTPPGMPHNPDSLYNPESYTLVSPPPLQPMFESIAGELAVGALRAIAIYFNGWHEGLNLSVTTVQDAITNLMAFRQDALLATTLSEAKLMQLFNQAFVIAQRLSAFVHLPLPAVWTTGLTPQNLARWAKADLARGEKLPESLELLPPLLQVFSVFIRIQCL